MDIAHWSVGYPHPQSPHFGHAIKRVVDTLRLLNPADRHRVYCFRGTWAVKVLSHVSAQYRITRRTLEMPYDEPDVQNVPLPILPKLMLDRWINPRWQWGWLRRFGRSLSCDLLHVHSCRSLSYGAALAARDRGFPLVLTLRREMMLEHQPSWRHRYLIESLRLAKKVIAPSAHLARRGQEAAGVDVELIPSGTHSLFDEPPGDGQRKAKILFVGCIEPNKAAGLLVQTALKLHREGIDFELAMIGEGPEKTALQKQAAGCEAVRFLGKLPPLDVRQQMRESMILCVPSYTETLGLVFLEAMKQGLAAVGRAGTGIDGMGNRGEHYEVISNDDELPALLKTLLLNPDRCRRLGQSAQKLAAGWTWESNAQRHAEIYRNLISENPVSGRAFSSILATSDKP